MVAQKLKRFAVVDNEYCCLFSSSSVPSFHLPTQPVHLLLCAYKREVAPLQENAQHHLLSCYCEFQSIALLLSSSPSQLAACTVGRDSRPPEPRHFESCTGEGR